jgi:hypothetical protein
MKARYGASFCDGGVGARLRRSRQGTAGHAAIRRGNASGAPDLWTTFRTRIIAAIDSFDESAIETIYESALALQPIEAVTRKLFVPVLEELGRRWEMAGESWVAEEHFFTTYTRNKLGARLHHRRRTALRLRLLWTCAPGQQHELGLLLFALAAHDNDVGCVLLGPDMPIGERASVCARARCDGVTMSMSTQPQGLRRVLAVIKPAPQARRAASAPGSSIWKARVSGRI